MTPLVTDYHPLVLIGGCKRAI